MENKFKIGDLVSFERNQTINSESVEVISIVESVHPNNKKSNNIENTYIIEHESGWTPNSLRKMQFGLDETKKYLFVQESELKIINE